MTDPATDHIPGDDSGVPNEPPGRGCGVQGCLLAAVGLFVVLLLAMLVIAAIRFSSPPDPRFGALSTEGDETRVVTPAPPSGFAGARAASPARNV